MKTNKLKICLALFLLPAFVLTGCDKNSASSSTTTTNDSTSSSFQEHDYTKDLHLTLDYKNHSFFTDGVGQVTLKTAIDGDTAHFEPLITTDYDTTVGTTIKGRFYGIDTPESTGKIEEWGKGASNYTKAQLKAADENGTIVVSAPITSYQAPEFDSTGTRYLSCVWINETVKDADYSTLTLLNLAIVQNGWSYVKALDKMPTYQDTFLAAEAQAKTEKLNLFSGGTDPLFNYGDYEDTSLLDIKKAVIKELSDSTYENPYDNAKIRVLGTVAGYSNHVLYIQNFYSADKYEGVEKIVQNPYTHEWGEYAGLNIFTGATEISSTFTKIGSYLQLCGTCTDSDTFGFQMSGCNFIRYSTDENDVQVLIKAADNTEEFQLYTFNYAKADLKNTVFESLYCSVNITDTVHVKSVYQNTAGDETTIYLSDAPFNIYVPFMYKGDPNNSNHYYSADDFENNVNGFTITGVYVPHKTTSGKLVYQIIPSGSTGLVDLDKVEA